jgi:hypothetical protein
VGEHHAARCFTPAPPARLGYDGSDDRADGPDRLHRHARQEQDRVSDASFRRALASLGVDGELRLGRIANDQLAPR